MLQRHAHLTIPIPRDDKTVDVGISLSLRMYAGSSEWSDETDPLIPFLVLNYLISNHFNEFASAAFSTLDNPVNQTAEVAEIDCKPLPEYSDEDLSSCVNTGYILSALFLGDKKANEKMGLLRKKVTHDFNIDLTPDPQWNYKVIGVLDGDWIRAADKDEKFSSVSHEQQQEKIKTYAQPGINNFFAYLQVMLNQPPQKEETTAELTNLFSTLKYNFNHATIQALKAEIAAAKVNQHQSMIYGIGVASHNRETTVFESGDELFSYEHVFMIEQFFWRGEVRFRLYQSWLREATLLDDIKKRKYGLFGEGSWNQIEMENFLNRFERYSCETEQPLATLNECFGYSEESKPLLQFEDQILTGVSVRYFSVPIDPKQCLKHAVDLIQMNPALKMKF